jgi:hypothetical protein
MTDPTSDATPPADERPARPGRRATWPPTGAAWAGLATTQFQPLMAQQMANVASMNAVRQAMSFNSTAALRAWSAAAMPQFPAAGITHAALVGPQLTTALDLFAVQRPAFSSIAAADLVRYSHTFAEQVSQIISSQNAVARWVLDTQAFTSTALLDTVGRYSQIQAQLGAFATDHDALLRGLTRVPARRYDAYLDGLPVRPIARRAAVASFAGDTQSGMLIAESLTSVGLDDDERDELADTFTTEVLEPWQSGPAQAREDLFAELAALEVGLPDFLKAAWDDIVRDGPKAASKIAHCSVECIDQTLRAIAPVDDVVAWMATVDTKRGWLDDKGRPTRRAKVSFAMRNGPNATLVSLSTRSKPWSHWSCTS